MAFQYAIDTVLYFDFGDVYFLLILVSAAIKIRDEQINNKFLTNILAVYQKRLIYCKLLRNILFKRD